MSMMNDVEGFFFLPHESDVVCDCDCVFRAHLLGGCAAAVVVVNQVRDVVVVDFLIITFMSAHVARIDE